MSAALGVVLAAHAHGGWEDLGAVQIALIAAAGLFSTWTIWRAITLTLRPGEREPDHIKRIILADGPTPGLADGPGPDAWSSEVLRVDSLELRDRSDRR